MAEDVEGLIAELREMTSTRAKLCVQDARRSSVGSSEFDTELAEARAVATVPYVRLLALEAILEKADRAADALARMTARIAELEGHMRGLLHGLPAILESGDLVDEEGLIEAAWFMLTRPEVEAALLNRDRDHG